jgi:hypothetical protein
MTDDASLPRTRIRLSGAEATRLAALIGRLTPLPVDARGPWIVVEARLRVTQEGVQVAVEHGGLGHLSKGDAERYAPVIALVGGDTATAYTQVRLRVLPRDEIEVEITGNELTATPTLPQSGKTGPSLPALFVYLILVGGAIAAAVVLGGPGRVVAGVLAAALLVLGGRRSAPDCSSPWSLGQ